MGGGGSGAHRRGLQAASELIEFGSGMMSRRGA
jgi:hypothetical protein